MAGTGPPSTQKGYPKMDHLGPQNGPIWDPILDPILDGFDGFGAIPKPPNVHYKGLVLGSLLPKSDLDPSWSHPKVLQKWSKGVDPRVPWISDP